MEIPSKAPPGSRGSSHRGRWRPRAGCSGCERGRELGLRAIGNAALGIVRIKAGFVITGAGFQSIRRADRSSRGRTALELGLGLLVACGEGHFNGRRALLRYVEAGVPSRLVMVGVDSSGLLATPSPVAAAGKRGT